MKWGPDRNTAIHNKNVVVVFQGSSVPNKGRSFISVVDIELKDLPDIPLNVPKPPTDQPPQPSQPPTLPQSTPPPSPTNAELHYNALFLKDAHPKRTPPMVQFEEMEGGPDEVTLRVLERRAKTDRYNQIRPMKQKFRVNISDALVGLWTLWMFVCLRFSFKTNLRSSSNPFPLTVPRTHNKAGDRTFKVTAAKEWNSPPISIQNSKSTEKFKKIIKAYIFFD